MNPVFKQSILKIIQDKLFIGLLLVGLLTVFIGFGASNKSNDDDKDEKQKAKSAYRITKTQADGGAENGNEFCVEPGLAVDFVKWWLTGAMDYNAVHALKDHEEAAKWMTNDAKSMFNANFWSPDLSNGILHGRYAGQFQTTNVKALAINPDGTVVVGFEGNMLFQTAKSPTVQQVIADVLVSKDKQGLRICGVYNRTMPIIGQVVR